MLRSFLVGTLVCGGDRSMSWLKTSAVVVIIGLGLGVGLVWGRAPALVEWQRTRAVCLQSDDWGLCGFLPDSRAIEVLDRQALAPGPFPDVYWHSTLEDSAAVASLCAVLSASRGRDGLPTILQANYILGSQEYAVTDTVARWIEHLLPRTPAGYERPGLWEAVDAGRRAGVWHPELHGLWHYDPLRRQRNTLGRPAVEAAAARQILVFPDCERSWELGSWRSQDVLEQEFARALAGFADLFGRRPRSIIGPDYVWNDADEARWVAADIRVIQGQRQQRKSKWRGTEGRIRKVMHRTFTRWWRRDRVYLDRNSSFEPLQAAEHRRTTDRTVAEVRQRWREGEPAIVETHRINFVHLDDGNGELGRRELRRLLDGLDADGAIFMTDGEVAELHRRGTSWAVRGGRIVVRNYTHSRRLVVVPAAASRLAASLRGEEAQAASTIVVSLAPGETRLLAARF